MPALALVASAIVLMTFAFRLRKHLDFSDHTPLSRTRSGDDGNALRVLPASRVRTARQFQPNSFLPLAHPCDRHNLPFRELEAIVLHGRLLLFDFPKAPPFP